MEQRLVECVTETNPGGLCPVARQPERPATTLANRPAVARRRGAPTPGRGPGSSVTIVTPRRGWFDWRLRQLWRYRDLITLFVWRDFVSLYKQTILGPAWHVLQPLLTTLTFTVVFSRVARLSTDGAAAVPVLHGGHHRLDLLRDLPDEHLQDVRRTRTAPGEGVLPPARDSALDRAVEPDRVRDSVRQSCWS